MPIERLQKFLPVLVILMVILVYAYCLGLKGSYPPSHPWSGITLILLSGLILKSRGPRRATVVGCNCALGRPLGLRRDSKSLASLNTLSASVGTGPGSSVGPDQRPQCVLTRTRTPGGNPSRMPVTF